MNRTYMLIILFLLALPMAFFFFAQGHSHPPHSRDDAELNQQLWGK